MSKPERIGIYGGTFDPIHNAHLLIARAAQQEAELDRVLFVVSARPPHKRATACASPEERYAMVEAAVADEPGLEPSRIEMDREGPSYTAETLRQLKARHPDADLFLIMGIDSLVDLPKWKDPQTILELAQLLVVPRPGEWKTPPELAGRYRLLEFARVPTSSTGVRQRIMEGEPLDTLVPASVKKFILEKGLYHACVSNTPRRRVP